MAPNSNQCIAALCHCHCWSLAAPRPVHDTAQRSTAQRSVSDVPHLSSDSKHYAVEGEMSDRVTCVGALILHVPLPELQRYSTCVCLGLRMMLEPVQAATSRDGLRARAGRHKP